MKHHFIVMRANVRSRTEKRIRHWQLIYVRCSLLFHFKFCSGTPCIDFKYSILPVSCVLQVQLPAQFTETDRADEGGFGNVECMRHTEEIICFSFLPVKIYSPKASTARRSNWVDVNGFEMVLCIRASHEHTMHSVGWANAKWTKPK